MAPECFTSLISVRDHENFLLHNVYLNSSYGRRSFKYIAPRFFGMPCLLTFGPVCHLSVLKKNGLRTTCLISSPFLNLQHLYTMCSFTYSIYLSIVLMYLLSWLCIFNTCIQRFTTPLYIDPISTPLKVIVYFIQIVNCLHLFCF